MSEEGLQRKLDYAPSASIDKVALNNKVVYMRAVVKRAKLYVINCISKQLKNMQRNPNVPVSVMAKRKRTADRLLEELKIIKVLKPDYVSKYALGNTDDFAKVAGNPKSTLEMRALSRLANHKFIQQEVQTFREKHEDWKDLAAYLMSKHTSREFKKKATKEKKSKVATNVLASEALVKTYLDQKLSDKKDSEDDNEDKEDSDYNNEKNENRTDEDCVDSEDNSDSKDDNEGSDSEDDNANDDSENDSDSGEEEEDNVGVENESDTGQDDDDDDDDDESDSRDDHDDESDSKEDDDVESDSKDDDDDESGSKYDDDDDIDRSDNDDDYIENVKKKKIYNKSETVDKTFFCEKKNISDKERKNKRTKENVDSDVVRKVQKTKTEKVKSVKKQIVSEKVEGEIVVKKLDLKNDKNFEEVIPEFLLRTVENKAKMKKLRNDMFFAFGDTAENDSDVEVEIAGTSGQTVKRKNHIDETVEDEETESKAYADDLYDAGLIKPTMKAYTTTFLGSLNSGKMMECSDQQFRSNEDWKRIRHEKKEQSFSRGRGSFRGKSFRGDSRGRPFRGGGSFQGSSQRSFHNDSGGGSSRGRSSWGQSSRGSPNHGRPYHVDSFGGQRSRGSFKGNTMHEKTDKQKQGSLHPSWEAKRKLKQEKTGLQQFMGKKIKFSDD